MPAARSSAVGERVVAPPEESSESWASSSPSPSSVLASFASLSSPSPSPRSRLPPELASPGRTPTASVANRANASCSRVKANNSRSRRPRWPCDIRGGGGKAWPRRCDICRSLGLLSTNLCTRSTLSSRPSLSSR
eukprot:1675038-Prymnesium_polylepis.1